MLREFGRRFAFAHFQIAQALLLDLAAGVTQIAALFWLGWTGRMSVAAACTALGGACALTSIAWLYLARSNFAIRTGLLPAAVKQSWGLGKWLFAGQITVSVQSYITYWLLALFVGTTATGVYTACMSVVSVANPLIVELGNILMPRAVLAFKEGGAARLRRQTIRVSPLLGAAMTLFCAAVAFAGEDVVRSLFNGKEYEGQGHTVTVLALALLASAVGFPASNALASMERPSAIVWVGLITALLTIVLVWWLIVGWGLLGAAYGFLAGNVAGAVGRWVAFLALVPRRESRPVRSSIHAARYRSAPEA